MTVITFPLGDPLSLPSKPNTAIAVGDLLIWTPGVKGVSAGYLMPLSAITPGPTEMADQLNAAINFAGVSRSRVLANDPAPRVRFDTEGIIEIPCVSDSFANGDLIAATRDGGSALVSQKVVLAPVSTYAIGIVVEDFVAATTVIKIRYRGMRWLILP